MKNTLLIFDIHALMISIMRNNTIITPDNSITAHLQKQEKLLYLDI